MFFTAGEVLEGEGEMLVADGAEVALEAIFEADGGFGVAVGDDLVDFGEVDEKFGEGGWIGGGDEEIEVVDRFLGAAVGTGEGGPGNLGMVSEPVEEGFGEGGDLTEAEAVGKLFAGGDGGEDFFDRFFAKAGELFDGIALAGGAEGVDGIDVELVVEGFDFFGSEALKFEEIEKGGGEFVAKGKVEFEFSGRGEFVNFLLEGIAESFDPGEFVVGGELDDVSVEAVDDFGSIAVSAGFEGIFAFEFKEEGDFFEGFHDGFAGDGGHVGEDGRRGEICKTKDSNKWAVGDKKNAMSHPNVKFYNEAIDAAQAGDLERARGAIEQALTEDANDVQSWQLYAVILNALGETEKAEKANAKVQEIGISEVDDLVMKAADAVGQGKFGVAITHYEDALELEPDRPELYVSYALALIQGNYPADAEEAATKAIELGSDDPAAWYAHGRVMRLRGKSGQGLESMKKALELNPEMVLARYECGMILAEKGELQEALEAFERVLLDHPTDENAIEAKARILEAMEGGK